MDRSFMSAGDRSVGEIKVEDIEEDEVEAAKKDNRESLLTPD